MTRRPHDAIVLRGDARQLPLPDASVDLIVTSPPYWSLRDYRDGEASLAGQIGNEPTPQEYIAALLDCTAEWARVLKPEGSIFVNLGDKYANRTRGAWRGSSDGHTWRADSPRYIRPKDFPEKSLLLLPERYRIGAVDQLGLIARAVIIWDKPNGLPESVTDRVRRSHEDWVHLTKLPRYYSAIDEIRNPVSDYTRKPGARRSTPPGQRRRAMADTVNPLGSLPSSVWEIPTEPFKVPAALGVDHFAAFPTAWPRRIIRGWSPTGICTECGEGRRPVSAVTAIDDRPGRVQGRAHDALVGAHGSDGRAGSRRSRVSTVTGYACACPEPTAPTRPAVVLDPFGGTGTTALVASTLGRRGVTVDRSAAYCRIATWRTTNRGERARALGLPRPPAEPEGHPRLFEATS
ncbi:DNA methyltransferase [Streptosporangium sp. NPDC002544]|uniref:DNA-methyltransferase n=1 Tax=Streptosporangium sp. NPDC002544 TaxID=3154538 RepID=UPI00332EA897